jgi:hypothetical protein
MIGTDKQGSLHFLFYGYKYPIDEEEKGLIKLDLFNLIDYASTQYSFHYSY